MRPEDVALARPVSSSGLFNAINAAYLSRHQDFYPLSPASVSDQPHSQGLLGAHVLAVDDSDINLDVVRHILESQGALVATCTDGACALEYVRAHQRQLDVVLMDVQMPLLDGNEVTRRIRNDLNLRALPIIALTAGALVGERARCLEAGMNDFVSKPFDPPVLIRKVRRRVQQVRGAAPPDAMPGPGGLEGAARWPQWPSLDTALLRQMYGNQVDLFTSLLTRMLHDYADFGNALVPPDDPRVRDAMRRRVHKLKGSAGLLGATHLMQRADAVERALVDGCETQILEQALSLMRSAFCALHEEAQALPEQSVEQPEVGATRSPNSRPLNEDIEHLCELLDRQDLQAIDRFHGLAQSWGELLQMAEFESVREAIDSLQFTLASERLRALWLIPGPAPRNATPRHAAISPS
jgi:CheY-like chemotaxis protein